jgi:hypothetical protein
VTSDSCKEVDANCREESVLDPALMDGTYREEWLAGLASADQVVSKLKLSHGSERIDSLGSVTWGSSGRPAGAGAMKIRLWHFFDLW